MSRLAVLAAAAAAVLTFAAPAAAGPDCADCYREVVHPPVYGTYAERYMAVAPRTVTAVAPPVYRTVTDKVYVPARKVWQVRIDAHGRRVGCWVTVPGYHEVRQRQILVSEGAVVPVAIPARFAYHHRPVLIEPARRGWAPIGY